MKKFIQNNTASDVETVTVNFSGNHQSLRKQINLLNDIGEIGSALLAATELEDLYHKIYDHVSRIIEFDAFFIALYEKGQSELDFVLLMDEGVQYENEKTNLHHTFTNTVIKTKKPILINRSSDDVNFLMSQTGSNGFGNKTRVSNSLLFVPVIIRDEPVGVISIQSYHFNSFNKYQLSLLKIIANQIAAALDRLKLHQQLKLQRIRWERIFDAIDIGVAVVNNSKEIEYVNSWIKQLQNKQSNIKTCEDLCVLFGMSCESCLLHGSNDKKEQTIELSCNGKIYLLTQFENEFSAKKKSVILIFYDITKIRASEESSLKIENLTAIINLVRAVVHQMSQPITGITCYSSVIVDEIQPQDKFYEEIKDIDSQAKRLEQLVKKYQQIIRSKLNDVNMNDKMAMQEIIE